MSKIPFEHAEMFDGENEEQLLGRDVPIGRGVVRAVGPDGLPTEDADLGGTS